MKPETLAILTIAKSLPSTRSAGKQGDRVSEVGPLEIWAKPLKGGDEAVGLFNRNESTLPSP